MKRAALRGLPRAGAILRLEAMALEIPEFPGHPNRVPFSGVLTMVDRPSDRAPSGAAGHRVLLPRETAERALPSLLGMAVGYAPGMRGHDAQRKIGVITRAEIRENRLEVAGHLFAKDFPDVVAEIRARRARLGMSYEVTGVSVENPAAEIWRLTRVVFTGAAILERSAAAYEQTSLAAGSSAPAQPILSHRTTSGDTMNENTQATLDLLAQAGQALAAEAAEVRAVLEEMRRIQAETARLLEALAEPLRASTGIEARVAELARSAENLQQQHEELRAHAGRLAAQSARKTVPPQVLALLSKSGISADAVGNDGNIEMAVLDKALEGLPPEQRMAVKSQLARAGALR